MKHDGKFFLVLVLLIQAITGQGCSIIATRPVQIMSDTSAAIRAAKEVQADTLAPELYRQSSEWFFRAKHEYKFKNFLLAREYAEKARDFAEQAEFESVRNGGNRVEAGGADPLSNTPAPDPVSQTSGGGHSYPTPQGTPAEEFEQRKAEEDNARKTAEEAQKAATPSPAPVPNPNDAPPANFFPRRR